MDSSAGLLRLGKNRGAPLLPSRSSAPGDRSGEVCQAGQGLRVRQDAGFLSGQIVPNVCANAYQGCLKILGPALLDTCPSTRRVPRCPTPWQCEPAEKKKYMLKYLL